MRAGILSSSGFCLVCQTDRPRYASQRRVGVAQRARIERGRIAHAMWGKAFSRCPRHCDDAYIGPMACTGGAVRRWRPQSPEGAPAPGSRMGA